MSLATTSTFTLSDFANIALGSTELTNEHLRVLQKLLIILLQKLNCHNETVRIQGFPAKCLENLLKDCTTTGQYNFQMKTIQKYQEKYELLDELEKKAQEINLKLEQHFQQIRNCHKTNMFEAKFWDFYASSDEDLCTLYKRSNKELCLLASNSKFNKELRSRVSQPVVKRLKEFEITIEGMQNKLKDLGKLSVKAAAKQKCVQYIIKDIEDMREALKTNEKQFREAMSEAQEMLNCKLERVALPALKIYLEQSFDKVKDYLKVLKRQQNKCPLLKPMIMENKKTCLSCGYNNELELWNQLKPLNSCGLRFKCFCNNSQKEPTILEKIDRMKLNEGIKVSASSDSANQYATRSSHNLLQLESHGILTNYKNSGKILMTGINNLSALKTSWKKKNESGLLTPANSLDIKRSHNRSISFIGEVMPSKWESNL